MTGKPPLPRKARAKRAPRKVSAASLENAALYYLERFSTSSENLRRVLMRRVLKSARHHGTEPEEGAALVDDLIARYLRSGLLDDRVYARAQAASMNRRGKSMRAIRSRLMQKGLPGDDIAAALEAFSANGDGGAGAELAAATAYARRRRIGPFYQGAPDGRDRNKEMAALARSGFSYSIAKRIVEAERADDLEDDRP